MTVTEKILAAHAGKDNVSPGELVNARVDVIMGHDLSMPLAIHEMEAIGAKKVFDPDRIVLVPDHCTPNKDIRAAENCKRMREFAGQQGISHYYEVGEMGIAHALLPEKGLVLEPPQAISHLDYITHDDHCWRANLLLLRNAGDVMELSLHTPLLRQRPPLNDRHRRLRVSSMFDQLRGDARQVSHPHQKDQRVCPGSDLLPGNR